MQHRLNLVLILTVATIVAATASYQAGYHNAKLTDQPKPPVTQAEYVALGDSIASGAGVEPYADPSACDRSSSSYPVLVSEALHDHLTNYACAGASVRSGLVGSQTINELTLSPQLEQLFSGPKPRLITITTGANDINWEEFITSCVFSSCGTIEQDELVKARLADFKEQLQGVLQQIASHYPHNPPRVVLTGYFNLYGNRVDCPDATGVTTNEAHWTNAMLEDLNSTIESASNDYGFVRVAIPNFSGHEYCSADPWLQSLSGGLPYHPDAQGLAEIAHQVEATAKQ